MESDDMVSREAYDEAQRESRQVVANLEHLVRRLEKAVAVIATRFTALLLLVGVFAPMASYTVYTTSESKLAITSRSIWTFPWQFVDEYAKADDLDFLGVLIVVLFSIVLLSALVCVVLLVTWRSELGLVARIAAWVLVVTSVLGLAILLLFKIGAGKNEVYWSIDLGYWFIILGAALTGGLMLPDERRAWLNKVLS